VSKPRSRDTAPRCRIENVDYIDFHDFVLVPSRQWGVRVGSGLRVAIELTTLYELSDGRIARIRQHDTLDDAREAALELIEARAT
jgi:hypothetical protein